MEGLGQLQACSLIILPSWDCCFTPVPLWHWASPMHLSGAPLWPRGPVLSIVWMRECSSLIPALRAMTCVLFRPFSGTVISTGVSTPLFLMQKTWLPFMAPERPPASWCRSWPPISRVATKMSWGRWPVIWGVAMERRAPLTRGSLCRTARGWLMLDMRWGAVWPRWRRPPLAMVWFHFGRVRLKGILTRGPPVIETRFPLLSHQGDSSDYWGSSSTSGFSPVKRSLDWVTLDISSVFGIGVVIPFIWTNAMTIPIRSEREQKKTKKKNRNWWITTYNAMLKISFTKRGPASSLNHSLVSNTKDLTIMDISKYLSAT